MEATSTNTANKVKDNFEPVADSAAKDAKAQIHQLKGKMESVGSRIDDMACKATKEASELATTVGHRVSGVTDSVKAEIHKNPVRATFIALAIGIVGTLFFKRAA